MLDRRGKNESKEDLMLRNLNVYVTLMSEIIMLKEVSYRSMFKQNALSATRLYERINFMFYMCMMSEYIQS